MGSILVEYEPEPSHVDLIRTNFLDFVPNLGWGTTQFELKVLSGTMGHGTMGGQGRPTKEILQIFLYLGLSFQPIRLRKKMVVSPSEMSK